MDEEEGKVDRVDDEPTQVPFSIYLHYCVVHAFVVDKITWNISDFSLSTSLTWFVLSEPSSEDLSGKLSGSRLDELLLCMWGSGYSFEYVRKSGSPPCT